MQEVFLKKIKKIYNFFFKKVLQFSRIRDIIIMLIRGVNEKRKKEGTTMKKVVDYAILYVTEFGLKALLTESCRVRGLVRDIAGSIGVTLTEDELCEAVHEVMGE